MGSQLHTELSRIAEAAGGGADDARVALGDGPTKQRLAAAIRALAGYRGPTSSICPSDAARAVGGANWRSLMNEAREVARELATFGEVEITQAGNVLDPGGQWHGPIRIRVAR